MAAVRRGGAEPARILFVGDDLHDGVVDRLTSGTDRIVATEVSCEEAAVERLEAEDIDCVVSAHDLDDGTGIDLLQRVRESHPELPFILTPTDGSTELESEATSLGASGYLPRDGQDGGVDALLSQLEAVTGWTSEDEHAPSERAPFEKLIQHSSDVVFLVDQAGVYQYVSPAVESVLGYEPEELLGVIGFDLVHPDDVEDTMEEFYRSIENPEYQPLVEFRAEHRDGSWRWLEVHGHNLLDDPDVQGFVVNARDVTERREYRRRVADQERRLQRIAENLPNTVIWMTDRSFNDVRYVSPGYEDLWGRSVDDLYANPADYLEGVHPEDQGRVLESVQRLIDEEGHGTEDFIEYRVVQPDGEIRWVQGTTIAVEGDGNEPAGWVGIATDITERKARERELEGYETLHATVPDGLFLIDESGTMHHVNEVWASMLGKDRSSVEGASFLSLVEEGIVEPSVPERYAELLRELLSSENDRDHGTVIIETSLPGQDRDHIYEANVRLLPYDETYRGSAIVVRDVTRLRRRLDDATDP